MPGVKQVPSLTGDSNGAALGSRASGRDLARPDFLSMSAEQQHGEVQRLVREAHAARTRLIHATIRSLLLWLRGAAIVAGSAISGLAMRLVAAYARRRQRMRAAAQLGAMSDRDLKDIGVSRSAIDWVVAHGRDDLPARAAGIVRPVLLRNPVSVRPPATSELSETVKQKRRAA